MEYVQKSISPNLKKSRSKKSRRGSIRQELRSGNELLTLGTILTVSSDHDDMTPNFDKGLNSFSSGI